MLDLAAGDSFVAQDAAHEGGVGAARAVWRGPLRGLRAYRSILVAKLDFIGDWVLCTPFLEALRRLAPQAAITALVLDRVLPLASACRFVDRVIAVTDGQIFHGRTAGETAAFRADLRSGAFDLALVPRWDADFNGAAPLAARSGAPVIVGFAEGSAPRRRELNRGHDRFFTHAIDERRLAHEAEQNLRLLALFGEAVPACGTSVHTCAVDERAAEAFMRNVFRGRRPVVAIAPFASEAKRMVPLPRLAALADRLTARFPVDLAIVAGPAHAADASRLAASLGDRAASAAGLGLRASAALMRRCAAVIAMDSGPAHIAAAVGTPVVVLSCHPADGAPGHENSPYRFAPRGRRVHVLQPQTAAPGCADGCSADRPHCILGLAPEPVWRAAARTVGGALEREPSPGGRGGVRLSRRDSRRRPAGSFP